MFGELFAEYLAGKGCKAIGDAFQPTASLQRIPIDEVIVGERRRTAMVTS
jgi:hypothetical protein